MKKIKLLTFLLLIPLLAGCKEEHQHTFKAEWSFNSETHFHEATCEHTDLKKDEGPHNFVNGICSVCNYEDPNYVTWTETQKQVFVDHLYGYELPCIKGLDVTYETSVQSVVVSSTSISLESFNAYVDLIASDGFSKQDGPYVDSYSLAKDIEVEGKTKCIEVDIFFGEGQMFAICYDPFVYEWPEEYIELLFDEYFYIKPTCDIPSVDADRYYLDTSYVSYQGLLAIYCDTNTNLESSYKEALTQNKFTVSAQKDETGFYSALDEHDVCEVLFSYSNVDKAFCIVIRPYAKGWPAFAVDYYTDQLTSSSGTRVPALVGADKYEFIDVYNRYGYFFVLCETATNFEEQYANNLDAHYEVYADKVNTAGNYYAVSDNNDLLVQYKYIVTESIMGGKPYKHFDVIFEKFFPYNEEHITAGLEIIQPGTKTTLPKYPGEGEKIDFSDSDIYMTVTIQATTYDTVADYAETLANEGWSVKAVNPLMYNYQAISEDRDIFMEISMVEGRVTLTLSAYADPYKEWPTEGIQEIVTDLGLKGTVPVFDNAFGFDYENTKDYHDVICFVPYGKEQELIDAYHQKLIGLGWHKLDIDDQFYYVKEGSTVGLVAYTEYAGEGKVFINIQYGDGNTYDLDARQAFIDWKKANGIDSKLMLPGINLTADIVGAEIYGDEGDTYEGYDLFSIIVDIGEASIEEAVAEVNSQFVDSGWVLSLEDGYYYKDEAFMTSYEYKGYLSIDVAVPIPDRSVLGVIKEFVKELGYAYSNVTLPESLEISNEYVLEIDSYEIGYTIDLSMYLTFANAAKATASKPEIINGFKAAGWTEVESYSANTICLKDKTNKLELEIYQAKNSKDLLVQIKDYRP